MLSRFYDIRDMAKESLTGGGSIERRRCLLHIIDLAKEALTKPDQEKLVSGLQKIIADIDELERLAKGGKG